MAKSTNPAVLDAALDEVRDNVTRITLCDTEPTSYAEANATYALADVTVSDADFTKANGDVSGRKLTVAQKTGVTVDETGTGTHIALLDVVGERLLYVTTCTSQAVTQGNTMTFNSWKFELADPS